MKKASFILPFAVALFFACHDKNEDNTEVRSGKGMASDSESIKTYTVADFIDTYAKEKSSLEGKTVIIEGYCTGYVPLMNKNKEVEGYRVPLSDEQESDYRRKKVFFIFNGNTDKKDFLRPFILKKKLKIKGEVTDEELFDKPVLTNAKLVK